MGQVIERETWENNLFLFWMETDGSRDAQKNWTRQSEDRAVFARLLCSGSTEWTTGRSAKKIAGQDSSSRTFLSSGCLFGFAGGGSTRASASAERPSIATAIVWPKSLTVPKPTAASS